MNIELLKKKIHSELVQNAKEFMKREDIRTRFAAPQIAYVDADHEVFDRLFMEGYTAHPKKIYRPGKSIITYFLPWSEDVRPEDGEAWSRAFVEAMWLSMELNRTICRNLDSVGRLHSHMCSMLDWNWKKHREDWDFRLTAALGGLGEIGPGGAFRAYEAEHGFSRTGGRCGGIITDGLYAGQLPEDIEGRNNRLTSERAKAVLGMLHNTKHKELVAASSREICPAGAIDACGQIDRKACQDFCVTINPSIPAPEVCGRCFKKCE